MVKCVGAYPSDLSFYCWRPACPSSPSDNAAGAALLPQQPLYVPAWVRICTSKFQEIHARAQRKHARISALAHRGSMVRLDGKFLPLPVCGYIWVKLPKIPADTLKYGVISYNVSILLSINVPGDL